MTRILFVCLGNICRSPMAEFIFKDMVDNAGIGHEFVIASAATSTEELGNPVPVSYTHLDVYKRQLYFCTLGFGGLGCLIDAIIILCGGFRDKWGYALA